MSAESFLSSIASSALWKGLDRLAGFLKHILVAATIGLSAQLDIFYMSIALLGVLVFSWASMIDVVAVPNMVRAWRETKYDDFRSIASGIFALTLIGSILLASLLYLGRDIISAVAIGFEMERRQLLAEAIPWLIPVILLYIPLRMMGAVLRALRIFSPFYQAEFIATFITLVCVWSYKDSAHVLLWSFSAGITLSFFFLLCKTHKHVLPLSNPFSHQVRGALSLAPGLLLLQGAHYAYVLTDRIFVSHLPVGAISALAYGFTIVSLFPSLASLSGSFITVIAEQGKIIDRNARLNDLLTIAVYLGAGSTLFMIVAGQSLTQILLERGVFTAANTSSVTDAITAYAWMIIPLFLIGALDQVFQVEKKIGFMVRRTILGLITNATLNAWFLFGLGWGLFGVALATTISYWIMSLSGLLSVERLGYALEKSRHIRWLAWNMVFLLLAFILLKILFSLLQSSMQVLLISTTIISLAMLVAGLYYRGYEQQLVVKTIKRIMRLAQRA